ncbi:MAG: hypothetical protein ABEJ56_05725 [Candidatus Nanohaloarchaea archaeon]
MTKDEEKRQCSVCGRTRSQLEDLTVDGNQLHSHVYFEEHQGIEKCMKCVKEFERADK